MIWCWPEFWIENVDGGWRLTYGYALAVLLLILIFHLLTTFTSKQPHPHAQPPSVAVPNNTPIPVISDSDLETLIDDLNLKGTGTHVDWVDVINRRSDRVSYYARCCKPNGGAPVKYLSVTVFENCSVKLLRDFYMDSCFRASWDKTLIHYNQLHVDKATGTEIGVMVKKFPLLTPREYVLAWRMWEASDGSFYCFTKECDYPLPRTRNKYVRVRLFRSGWRISKVPGRDACEIQMVHQEDAGLNAEMARLGFAKGIWKYVCKMDDALRRYEPSTLLTSEASAITLVQKVPRELDTLRNSDNCSGGSLGETSATREQERNEEPLNNVVPNMLVLLGGAICLSKGISSVGAKIAMACILGRLVKRNAFRTKSLQRDVKNVR